MHHDNPGFQGDSSDHSPYHEQGRTHNLSSGSQNGGPTSEASAPSLRTLDAAYLPGSLPSSYPVLSGVELNTISNGKDLEADEYDPYENRNVPHPISNFDALFHMMKASCGTGILAMPTAFLHAGYVVGLIGTALIGTICTYCVHILIQSEIAICRRRKIPSLTYHEIAREAFLDGPPIARALASYASFSVQLFLCIYQVGACSVYTVFVASNLKQVVDASGTEIDVRLYMCMLLVPLILINWIRNLKYLAPCSTFAVAMTVVAFSVVLYYIFRDLPPVTKQAPFAPISDLPLFFGTVIFALEAIGVIVPLENEMRTPKKFLGFRGVLNQGMVPIVFMYIFLGFFGYIRYGEEALGSITLNLPEDEGLAQAVKILIALAIFGTHPLQCYVVVDIVWNTYLAPRFVKHPRKLTIEMAVRTGIVVFAFLLAVAIPELDPFISLVGALSLSMVGILLPAAIQLCAFWYEYTGARFTWLVVKNTFLVLFSFLGLVTGTYSSILSIIDTFK